MFLFILPFLNFTLTISFDQLNFPNVEHFYYDIHKKKVALKKNSTEVNMFWKIRESVQFNIRSWCSVWGSSGTLHLPNEEYVS